MHPFLRQALLAACLLAVPAVGLAADIAQPVRIVTEGARPPFNYVENGEPAGFDVDLARALCEAAKLACTIALHPWEGIIRGLVAKEYDAIASSMAILERRQKRIAFTRPYYRMPGAFLARKGSEVRIDSAGLRGRVVGVVGHGPWAALLKERFPGAEERVFDKVEDANLDLLTGRIDLVFHEKLALFDFVSRRDGKLCCRLVGDVPPEGPDLGPGVGIGLRKEDEALRAAFDKAIEAVMADGTYDRIRAKYVPFDIR